MIFTLFQGERTYVPYRSYANFSFLPSFHAVHSFIHAFFFSFFFFLFFLLITWKQYLPFDRIDSRSFDTISLVLIFLFSFFFPRSVVNSPEFRRTSADIAEQIESARWKTGRKFNFCRRERDALRLTRSALRAAALLNRQGEVVFASPCPAVATDPRQ